MQFRIKESIEDEEMKNWIEYRLYNAVLNAIALNKRE